MVGVKARKCSIPESYGYIGGPFHEGNFLILSEKPETESTYGYITPKHSELCTLYLGMIWQGTRDVTTTKPSLMEDGKPTL